MSFPKVEKRARNVETSFDNEVSIDITHNPDRGAVFFTVFAVPPAPHLRVMLDETPFMTYSRSLTYLDGIRVGLRVAGAVATRKAQSADDKVGEAEEKTPPEPVEWTKEKVNGLSKIVLDKVIEVHGFEVAYLMMAVIAGSYVHTRESKKVNPVLQVKADGYTVEYTMAVEEMIAEEVMTTMPETNETH